MQLNTVVYLVFKIIKNITLIINVTLMTIFFKLLNFKSIVTQLYVIKYYFLKSYCFLLYDLKFIENLEILKILILRIVLIQITSITYKIYLYTKNLLYCSPSCNTIFIIIIIII